MFEIHLVMMVYESPKFQARSFTSASASASASSSSGGFMLHGKRLQFQSDMIVDQQQAAKKLRIA